MSGGKPVPGALQLGSVTVAAAAKTVTTHNTFLAQLLTGQGRCCSDVTNLIAYKRSQLLATIAHLHYL